VLEAGQGQVLAVRCEVLEEVIKGSCEHTSGGGGGREERG